MKNVLIFVLILLIVCGCSQSIREYQLKSPEYVEEAVATNMALLEKNQELIDKILLAIQKEVCKASDLFRTGYLKPHFEQEFGITFSDDFCRIRNE